VNLADQFNTAKDGRLIFASDSENEKEITEPTKLKGEDNSYLEAIAGKESFTRVGRKIKYLSANKKQADNEEFAQENEHTEEISKSLQRHVRGIGLEYKAKKAGGDVKRSGMPDPYAYIPLNAKIVGNRHKSVRLVGPSVLRKVSGHKVKKHKK
jgi:hypothetical protein